MNITELRLELLAAFNAKKRQVTPTDRYYLSESDFHEIIDRLFTTDGVGEGDGEEWERFE